jgi:uncharacterized protein YbjQ (UPF0145 family)
MQASTGNITSSQPMIVTTTENIPGTRVVKTIGQVFGLTVRSRSLGGNIAAGLKGLVGGEIGSYVKLNEDSRRQALDRMVQNAAAMGANAVIMMRFDSTEMGRSMSEIVAYRKGAGTGSGSEPTSEVFIDPATGQRMRVWYDPATGDRQYRPE